VFLLNKKINFFRKYKKTLEKILITVYNRYGIIYIIILEVSI